MSGHDPQDMSSPGGDHALLQHTTLHQQPTLPVLNTPSPKAGSEVSNTHDQREADSQSPPISTSSYQPSSSPDNEAPLSFSSASPSDTESLSQAERESLPPIEPVLQAPIAAPLVAASVAIPPHFVRPSMARSGSDPLRMSRLAHDTAGVNHQAEAGPSHHSPNRRMRYADPDQHWLSEDEGQSFSRDVNRARHRHRQRGHDGPGSSGDGADDKESGRDKDSALHATTERTARHAITHKPATVHHEIGSKDTPTLLPNLSSITPNLLRALACPSCDTLMQDPTTLLCGHSLCLGCSIARNAPKSITNLAPFPPAAARAEQEEGDLETDAGVPSNPLDLLASISTESKMAMSDAVCPLPGCRKVTKATSGGRTGLRTDFVLQKLSVLLRTHLQLADEDGEDLVSDFTSAQTVESYEATEQDQSLQRSGSSPDEEVKAEDSMKRAMGKRRSGYLSNKKSRAGHVHASGGFSFLPTLVSETLSELECQVCVTLLYEPMTGPCGHTFCKRCLFRSLDHSNRCPLCRTELPGFAFFLTAPPNHTISNLLVTTFPMMYQERREIIEKEEAESGLDTPVFVCMVAFPTMPTNLHIYEPRYRLMMRRAMDKNKRFGMVLPSRTNGGFSQFGTMLEIHNIEVFDDGRSLIESVGVHRFKILESGTLDGYNVGRVERIEDIGDEEEAELERLALERSVLRRKAEQEELAARGGASDGSASHSAMPGAIPSSSAPQQGAPPAFTAPPMADPTDATATDSVELTNAQLLETCKNFVEALRTGSTPWLLQRLSSTLPPMPDDAREFTWWMAMLMPIDDHEKAKLLQITSYRLRLRLLVFWIQQMQDSWWFSRGCSVS